LKATEIYTVSLTTKHTRYTKRLSVYFMFFVLLPGHDNSRCQYEAHARVLIDESGDADAGRDAGEPLRVFTGQVLFRSREIDHLPQCDFCRPCQITGRGSFPGFHLILQPRLGF